MEFLYDEPIRYTEDDLLNRTNFAKDFALNILSIPKHKSMTISINGEWGSGKTSLINLIKNEIKDELRKRKDSNHENLYYQVIDFAPWNTLDENAIINQFFNMLSSNFSEERIKKMLKTDLYKGVIAVAKELPKIGCIFKGMDSLLKKYSKSFLNGDENLLEIKNKISNKLLGLPGKFIVFIDDIDRLNKKEIKLLIQLIKAVFDFPNVIYILSFDKEIVADALSNEQSINGSQYLEKIIQLSLDIPEIEKENLYNYLFKKLDRVLENSAVNNFDSSRWGYIFRGGYSKYFKTLRNINRYINSINIKQIRYLEVIDCLDFFVMEAISLFEPDVLRLIKGNRELLCRNSHDDSNKTAIETFEKDVMNVSSNYELLTYLFPILQNNKFGYYSDVQNNSQRKINGRICNKEYFDFYFNGILNDGFVSKVELKNFVKMNNREERIHYLKSLNNRSFSDFLIMLYYYNEEIKNINDVNPECLFDIIECESMFKDLSKIFAPKHDIWVTGIIDKYISVFNNETLSMIFLKELFEKNNNLKLLIIIMYHLSQDTNMYFNNQNIKPGKLNTDNLQELHEILINRINEYIENKENLLNKDLVYMEHFMNIKDSIKVKTWFDKLEQNEINLLINNFYFTGYGESSTRFLTYRFNFEDCSKYMDVKEFTQYLENKLVEKNVPAEIGEVLFMMPPCNKDDHYQMKDLYEFCKENKILFNKKDEFIDK